MAEEFDRKILPDLLQTAFSVSLGACYKSVEMMKTPQDSLNKMMSEAMELFSVTANAPGGLPGKAEAVAGMWVSKGMDLMETCRNAGEKFTETK